MARKQNKKTSVPEIGRNAEVPEFNPILEIPPLGGYLHRIGAEVLNFKRFLVKEHHGNYYTEKAVIKIEDGEIWCNRKDFAPTKEEAEAIRLALRTARFPRSIEARNLEALQQHLGSAELYPIYNQATGGIIMVQQRVEKPDGGKIYPPWALFDDGVWRRMEPDGPLPFWKPAQRRNVARIMVHEGAKAAQFTDDLVNNPSRRDELLVHPWRDDLVRYEHRGILGGAMAPHRADFDELRREKVLEVIYICDNDWPGKSALQEVSRCYRRAMKGVLLDARFKDSWDLADEMPRDLFRGERWVGPKFTELLVPATYATELVPQTKGKSVARLLRDFREEWFHCVTPEVFVHRDWPDRVLDKEGFNSMVAPFSDVAGTAALLVKDAAAKGGLLKYSPAVKSGIYSGEEGRYINTHVPSSVKSRKGDFSPFLDFLDHLVPADGDRLEVMRWCATLIARPEIKMLYGLLMISETQGVGKSTLGEKVLAPLIGGANASYPQENEIVDSAFNNWLAHKRLAVVHEIYAGHSSKAYNRLKNIITDRIISINRKFMAPYDIDNWVHIYACSNSMRALQLPDDDRRWFVPRVNEAKKPLSYWIRFNRWLNEESGLEIIRYWAEEWLKEELPVLAGAAAPDSELKRELIDESLSLGQQLVAQVLDQVKLILESDVESDQKRMLEWKGRGIVNGHGLFMLDTALVQLIKDELYEGRHNDRLERPLTIRKLARGRGWYVGKVRATIKDWGGVGGRLIATSAELAAMNPSDICNERMKVEDRLRPLDPKTIRGM